MAGSGVNVYAHKYIGRCDIGHGNIIRATSQSEKKRERHYEFCRDCNAIVPMRAQIYLCQIEKYYDESAKINKKRVAA